MKTQIINCINSRSIRFLFIVLCIFTAKSSLHAQWIETNGPGSPVVSLLVQGTDLYAGTNTARGPGGVYLSSLSNPTVWTPINSGLANHYVTALGVYNSVLFAGIYPSGPFYRYSGGTWDSVSSGIDTYVITFASQDNMFFAGTFLRGVYRSSNGGSNWTQVNSGLTAFPAVQCFVRKGNNLFLGTSDSGIYRSTNYGTNWVHTSNGLLNQNVYALALVDSMLFASVPGGFSFSVYRSTNNGANWEQVNSQGQPAINQFAVSGHNIFGVAFAAGVFLSTDLGVTWNPVNTGLPFGVTMLSIAVGGTNLYLGSSYTATTNGFVYYRPLSEMITSVHEVTGIPAEFRLEQNYPNPFNPTTHFGFGISELGFVSLKIYNSIGKEVAILLNERKNVGNYNVEFDGSNFPSGVYYYELKVEGDKGEQFTAVKKMVMMK